MKCQAVIEQMEKLAPKTLAEQWDNVGLLVGSPSMDLKGIYLALDVTRENVEDAIKKGCNLIIAHHPLIFHPLKNLRTDLVQGMLLERIIEQKIAIYAAHTNLDIATGGVNDVLAELIGLADIRPFVATGEEKYLKFVTYVPKVYAQKVRDAIAHAGAGYIGHYSHCTFNVLGEGTFRPERGTSPFIGTIGKIERVEEVRIETIIPEKSKEKVLEALRKLHPYEEIAYDLYPLANRGKLFSLGRIGELKETLTLEEVGKLILEKLPATHIRLVKTNDKKIKKIALCSGSGSEFIDRAKFMGADLYLTGDVKYHEAQRAKDIGLNLIDAGHFPTEYPVIHMLEKYLSTYLAQKKTAIHLEKDLLAKDIFEVMTAKKV